MSAAQAVTGDVVVVHSEEHGDVVGVLSSVVEHLRHCEYCGAVLEGGRRDRMYCNSSCRGFASVARGPGERFWRGFRATMVDRPARLWIRPRRASRR